MTRPRSVRASLLIAILLWLGCGDEYRKIPFAEELEDLRAGRVQELHICPNGGQPIHRYLRPGRGPEPERVEAVSPPGGGDAQRLAEAEGVTVRENGELCD